MDMIDKNPKLMSREHNAKFDVIVVGTGPGGGTIGFALAKKGFKVLFLEKGESYANNQQSLKGDYAEMFADSKTSRKENFRHAGRYFETILESKKEQTPFIGCSVGGSTSLFGMAMERFFECDFTSRPVTDLNKASALPKNGWPFNYADLLPYYFEAEKLYNVKGIGDPLRKTEKFGYNPPPPITKANQELFNYLADQKMSPYILPRSCDFVPGCIECQGFLCSKNCKNDSYKMCVQPAMEKYNAAVYTNCDVLKLLANENKITGVVCKLEGRETVLSSELVILAAGAIGTPTLLLNSRDTINPNGLSNKSGQVGRNLMRHCIDMYIVKTKAKAPNDGFIKEIAFNDLYAFADERLGTIQSFGRLPPKQILSNTIFEKLNSMARPLGFLFNFVRPIAEFAIEKYFSGKVALATILEDLPYSENRVTTDNATGKPIIEFKLFPYEVNRIKAFRIRASKIFEHYRVKLIKQAESNKRLAHVCGTCRLGDDPSISVVDKNCRSHEIKNLYISDASVFPTSGGTNPVLTIVANALRIADNIHL